MELVLIALMFLFLSAQETYSEAVRNMFLLLGLFFLGLNFALQIHINNYNLYFAMFFFFLTALFLILNFINYLSKALKHE